MQLQRRRWIQRGAACLGYLTVLGLLPGQAAASNPVTSLADSGPGSLRQAIANALPGDTITFSVTGTIVLTSGELVLDKDLTLQGPGQQALAISGNLSSRVMSVAAGVSATLQGLTLTSGLVFEGSGGGLLNDGDLALFDCAIVQSEIHSFLSSGGGGIGNNGTLAAVGCTIAGNLAHIVDEGGGGIRNTGTMDLFGCTVSGNSGEFAEAGGVLNTATAILTLNQCVVSANDTDAGGGGIVNDGFLTVFSSTLSGNVALGHGGGIYNRGIAGLKGCTLSANSAVVWGGGIMNWGTVGATTISVTNCTISGNLADLGGGLSNFDDMIVSHSTITANAFGVENLGPLLVKNTIVANNLYQDCIEPATAMSGVNYDSDGSCGPGFTLASPAQLEMTALANHGGPTWTHALLPGSIAIGQATDCTDYFGVPVLTDQRGVPRPQGSACEVGAYERVQD